MAKTNFINGTIVQPAWLNSVFSSGHRHDGVDDDGHCSNIEQNEVAKQVLTQCSFYQCNVESVSSKAIQLNGFIGLLGKTSSVADFSLLYGTAEVHSNFDNLTYTIFDGSNNFIKESSGGIVPDSFPTTLQNGCLNVFYVKTNTINGLYVAESASQLRALFGPNVLCRFIVSLVIRSYEIVSFKLNNEKCYFSYDLPSSPTSLPIYGETVSTTNHFIDYESLIGFNNIVIKEIEADFSLLVSNPGYATVGNYTFTANHLRRLVCLSLENNQNKIKLYSAASCIYDFVLINYTIKQLTWAAV
jgi:hypothetical protein